MVALIQGTHTVPHPNYQSKAVLATVLTHIIILRQNYLPEAVQVMEVVRRILTIAQASAIATQAILQVLTRVVVKREHLINIVARH